MIMVARTGLLALLCVPVLTFGQIALEHIYPATGYFDNYEQHLMVDLEVSGQKYASIDGRIDRTIVLYNLDHTWYKTISFQNAPAAGGWFPNIMYISEHLFDLDDDIEFMFVLNAPGGPRTTIVYNEDGTILLDATGGLPLVMPTYHNQHYPIYNTSVGTKLILSFQDSTAHVFSLAGTLSPNIITGAEEMAEQAQMGLFLFPNPADEGAEVLYQLPQGSGSAELIFYNTAGQQVLQLPVQPNSERTHISTAQLPAGTYLYQLRTGTEVIGGPRLVVVH